MNTPTKYLFIWFVYVMCIGLTARAQKLPNVQEKGVFAPANVKIDGKATEWNKPLQAFNKSTSIYYTIANNADNLYLAVQATNKTIIDKLLGGGLTLLISTDNKMVNPISITTPILPADKRIIINTKTKSDGTIADSALRDINNALSSGLKQITIKGIPAITEATIPVYNDLGILIAGKFDVNKTYTCELAIPVKYLNNLPTGTFNYTIKLNAANFAANGAKMNGKEVDPSSPALAAIVNQIAVASVSRAPGNVSADIYSTIELTSTTDFSGTYTLVKK